MDSQSSDCSSLKSNKFQLQREVHILSGATQPVARRNNGSHPWVSFSSSGKEVTSPGPGRKLKLQILPPPLGCGGGGLGPRGILKGGLSGLLGEEPWRRFQRRTSSSPQVSTAHQHLLLPALLFPLGPGNWSRKRRDLSCETSSRH